MGEVTAGQAHPRPLPQAGGEFGKSSLTLCALAARALGWRPDDFWNATPAELATCLADPAAHPGSVAAPLARGDLERLMEDDPDGHR